MANFEKHEVRCNKGNLSHLDGISVTGFKEWLNGFERRKEINEITNWRNTIAHGYRPKLPETARSGKQQVVAGPHEANRSMH